MHAAFVDGLGLVKDEFAEAFVRSAATKRTVDPTATLTPVEREAVAHLSNLIAEFRDGLEEDNAAAERRKPGRRYLAHVAGASKKRAFNTSRRRDAAAAVVLIEKLRNESISAGDATQLIELLTKLDLRRRSGGGYEDIAETDRGLGF